MTVQILNKIEALNDKIKSHNKMAPSIEQLQSYATELWALNGQDQSQESHLLLNEAFMQFSKLLDKAWHIDESFVEPFSLLTDCHNQLIMLRGRGYWSNEEIRRLQDIVNQVENKWVHNQKFHKAGSDATPMGQAVMFSLLHHIHRLTRWMLEENEPINAFLKPIREQLLAVHMGLDELMVMIRAEDVVDWKNVASVVTSLQETLNGIESQKQDGLFVPSNWDKYKSPTAIPEGQAECRYLVETAHDKIYEILVAEEANEESKKSALSLNTESIEELQKHVVDLTQRLGESAKSEVKWIGNALHNAYNKLHHLMLKSIPAYEAVNPSLSNMMSELQAILDGLKKSRTRVLQAQTVQQHESEKIQMLRERLNAVDAQRVDGRFVGDDGDFAPKGQAVLVSMLEQAYATLAELNKLSE